MMEIFNRTRGVLFDQAIAHLLFLNIFLTLIYTAWGIMSTNDSMETKLFNVKGEQNESMGSEI